jgi:hypothetical protein
VVSSRFHSCNDLHLLCFGLTLFVEIRLPWLLPACDGHFAARAKAMARKLCRCSGRRVLSRIYDSPDVSMDACSLVKSASPHVGELIFCRLLFLDTFLLS